MPPEVREDAGFPLAIAPLATGDALGVAADAGAGALDPAGGAAEGIDGAGAVIEGAGGGLEAVGGCLEGCGGCSLALLLVLFAATGSAVAFLR